ncbi:MAG: peptidase S9, partial [Paludibacter sp.]|nr:peptidase S9 [Paludibacter sp.]
MAMALTAVSCSNSSDSPVIGRQYPEIKDNRMSPEVLWAMGRVGGVQVSPDGKRVLYSVSYYSVEQDKSNSDLFMMNTD